MAKKEACHSNLPLMYRLLPPCILTLITTIAYYPSLHYEPQFDDIANIKKNYFIRHHQLKTLWCSGSRWISYWLNAIYYSIGKFDPFTYRVGNLIIHSINGILLFYLILYALLHSKGEHFFKRNAAAIATVTAMLFLLHPVQTQTVSYIVQGQLEGLACMSILAMALVFMHFCYTKKMAYKVTLGILLIAIAVLSCGTKEIAFISPFLIMLIDWFFVAHGKFDSFEKRIPLHALLFSLVTGLYLWFLKPAFFTEILGLSMTVKNNIGNVITTNPQDAISPGSFFISQFKVILHYIWIFLWPWNISVEYDWVLSRSFFAWDCFLPFLVLMGLALGIFRVMLTRGTHVLCFGALWFFICIAPRSSIIPSPELLVDYKTYIASIGWLLIIATALVKATELILHKVAHIYPLLKKRQAHLACLFVLCIPLSLATWQRNLVWSSGTQFWMNVILNAPGKARGYNNYAVELSQIHKQYAEAIPYFKKATQMDRFYPDPWNNLAVCYSQIEQIDNAITALNTSLRINPYYAEGHNNLASFYMRKKEYDKADHCLKIALQLRPHYGKAYYNLGRMHNEQGNKQLALECFKKACTIADLDNEFGFKVYAEAAFNQQQFTEALWGFKKALEHNPNDASALFSTANCYYLLQQYEQAALNYKAVIQHAPTDLKAWFNLGESYVAMQDFAQALACYEHIEPQWQEMPQVRMRLAQCHEKMGNPNKAQAQLKILASTQQVPVPLRLQAQGLLGQLEGHYPHLKVGSVSV